MMKGGMVLNTLPFGGVIYKVLGDGQEIGFWKEKWLGTTSFRAMFPAPYSKSVQQDDAISAMGVWNSDSWTWTLAWTAELTDSETETVAELLSLLQQIWPSRDNSDRRRRVLLELP
jgi:hypothetical protein